MWSQSRVVLLLCFLLLAPLAGSQQASTIREDTLPNGKSRKLAIIRDDYKHSLEDVTEILKLAHELEDQLLADTEHVVNLDSMKKAEQIEELAKSLQKRMKRIY
ncbi:MAG: hypothetical protein GC160_10295 [Acidobacteria bacterium]|nr:hypothetical protein [Acidobacteriota bacterium]